MSIATRRRRVVFVTPMHFGPRAYVGGGERYPLNLARGVLAASTYAEVDVIGVGDEPTTRWLQPRLCVQVLRASLPGPSSLDHISGDLQASIEQADLVHVHQAFTRSSQLAILIAKFLGKPVVITDHGARTNHIDKSVPYMDLADLLVFQSRFASTLVASNARREIIPGGVDARFFRPPDTAISREFVLYVGRLLPHKGVDRLLCALPKQLPCVIAGTPYDEIYARYLRALAAGRDVTFIQDADDVTLRDLYRRAWAAVLPSVRRDAWGTVYRAPELMGLTPLEAMACGTPAIVSTAGALPEFIRPGSTGFVFDDLTELREQLLALSEGVVDPAKLGQEARRVVESEYALDVVGERLWNAYLENWGGERVAHPDDQQPVSA